ncbi:coiled-coil domain-containing protein 43 [Lucilia sericata]|uniref:coiled-coil domain-containing protein 43 n=1 Tax=Lucilia sericata TaxID=13632 RepID=UPI0018A85446|nr:coiled-coil domain-containing protein 43 [Lucilia sericata]
MAVSSDFATWLNLKLQELNTDESVFGSYILGILEGDEAYEEKHEALEGIFSEILSDNIESVVQSILEKWEESNKKIEEPSKQVLDLKVEEQLVKLLETTKVQAVVKERHYTEEEKRIREQILAQYSQTEVSEEEYEAAQSDEEADKHGSSKSCGLERNTNFSDVVALQKEKREQARLDSAAKKQKDKEDREKQKQLREEKKEKRKTVKGERRR